MRSSARRSNIACVTWRTRVAGKPPGAGSTRGLNKNRWKETRFGFVSNFVTASASEIVGGREEPRAKLRKDEAQTYFRHPAEQLRGSVGWVRPL